MNEMKEELWAAIASNPSYEVSNRGRVRSKTTGLVLTPTLHGKERYRTTAYYRIELKSPRRKYLVHRLVAAAFIPNPLGHAEVNHKDEDGLNNDIGNLEWCDTSYNVHYSQNKPVIQSNKLGRILNRFESLTEAGTQTGADIRLISAVCLGKRQTHMGFIWTYEREMDLIKKRRERNNH